MVTKSTPVQPAFFGWFEPAKDSIMSSAAGGIEKDEQALEVGQCCVPREIPYGQQ